MTNHNLLKTVIEGGRVLQRRRVRRRAEPLLSAADRNFRIWPTRKVAWREFSEKLGPTLDVWASLEK